MLKLFLHLENLPEVRGDRGEDDLMSVDGGPVSAGQGHVHKVLKFVMSQMYHWVTLHPRRGPGTTSETKKTFYV